MDDYEKIRRLIAEYCFATDTGDTARWVSLFSEDVRWEGGAFGRFEGREAATAYHRAAGDASKNFRHVTTNLLIDLDGDRAAVSSYVQVYDQSGQQPALMFSGVYQDALVKQGDTWLIKERHLHPHPSAISGGNG